MSKPLSYRRQCEIIRYMLDKAFPGIDFKVAHSMKWNKEHTMMLGRVITISFNSKLSLDLTVKEVVDHLKRFQDDPADDMGIEYLRTFWVNKEGFTTVSRIRALHPNGNTRLVEKFAPPLKGGPYEQERFSTSLYEVIDTHKPKKKPYLVYDYGVD